MSEEEKEKKKSNKAAKRRRKKKLQELSRWSGLIVFLVMFILGVLLWVSGEVKERGGIRKGILPDFGGGKESSTELEGDVIIIE